MGILDVASQQSVGKGYDYYLSKVVYHIKQLNETQFDSKVRGSGGKVYQVHLDIDHPKRSTCNCPHAYDRRVVCKHIVATFFTVQPEEVEWFESMLERAEEDYEERVVTWHNDLKEMINHMTEAEVRAAYLNCLIDIGFLADRYDIQEDEWY
ncbi:SWIM zinc finger family protein [Staphylococcus warneri]|uniref:SWIM zinc finger family protein n=1 Tax=Staphylococcus warneri TaxID=1292 RepID=UPI0032614BA5